MTMIILNEIIKKINDFLIRDFDALDFLIGLCVNFIILLFKQVIDNIKNKINKRRYFNISGYWSCEFDSFVYKGRKVVEIYKIKQKGDDIAIDIISLNDEIGTSSNLMGRGKIRDSFVCFYYSTKKATSNVIGVMWLKIITVDVDNIMLIGNCYEDFSNFSDKTKDDLVRLQKTNQMIKLQQIKISLPDRIFLRFGSKKMLNYNRINNMIKKAK